MSDLMRAIRVNRLGAADVLELESVPVPTVEADQVLVKIEAIGVNPVDTYIRSGYQGYNPTVPYTPGYDAAGTVAAIGSSFSSGSIKAGSRVYLSGSLSGTYAEYAVCTPSQVHPLADHVSFTKGAAVFVAYVTAYRGLVHKALAKAGETVLIHGASGAVGLAAIQFARNAGLRIIATASTAEGKKLAKENGADSVLDHSDIDHFRAIRDYTEDRGVDIILEMVAHQNLAEDLKILAPNGRVIVIGSQKQIVITPRDLMACDGSIRGMSLMNIDEADQEKIHAAIVAGLSDQTLDPVIRCELPLTEVSRAHELVMQPGACGKLVLLP